MSRLTGFLFIIFLFFPFQRSLAYTVTYGQRLCHSDANLTCIVVKKKRYMDFIMAKRSATKYGDAN